MFKLRPYQNDAIRAVIKGRENNIRRMLICLPTGSGKTVIFSRLAAMAEQQVLVLAHREELLEQARDKILRTFQSLGIEDTVEIEQGNRRASRFAKVAVCSLRSLRPERLGRMMQGRRIGLIIYDECHHAAAEDNRRILEQIGCFEHDWPGTLLGFTATTQRGDGQGLDEVFEKIIYTRTITQMIDDGFLSPLRGYRITTHADLQGIGSKRGDFNIEALAEAVDIQERNALVARSIQELARDRRTLVFCVTVAHAKSLARALNTIGISAGFVHGEMKREQRKFVLQNFRDGTIQALTNVMVLTEGFDDPGVSCIAMARPTRSSSLYTQCVGRGTRICEGKKDCLILDFVDLNDVELTTLPSLFGKPYDLQPDEETQEEEEENERESFTPYHGLEVDPDQISLSEIQERAASFDPLTLSVDPEVRAISNNDWISIGAKGLALHIQTKSGKKSTFLIIQEPGKRKKRYQILLDEEPVATFSSTLEAVEAVDYEIHKMGKLIALSAIPDARWRHEPLDNNMERKLRDIQAPRGIRTTGEAMQHLTRHPFLKSLQHPPKKKQRSPRKKKL